MFVGLALVGWVSSVVNTVAGGGSLFVLPALLAIGLEPQLANGTNRVGVLVQAVVAVASFRAAGIDAAPRREEAALVGVGALAGALAAASVDPGVFAKAAAALLLMMVASAWVQSDGWTPPERPWPAPVRAALLLGAGAYGGFLQAGVGFLLLFALVYGSGRTVREGNPVKSALTLVLTVPALLVFQRAGQAAWGPGLALAAGGVVGGWQGARVADRLSPKAVRLVLTVMVLAVAGRLATR